MGATFYLKNNFIIFGCVEIRGIFDFEHFVIGYSAIFNCLFEVQHSQSYGEENDYNTRIYCNKYVIPFFSQVFCWSVAQLVL